jgi:hypothetical protein
VKAQVAAAVVLIAAASLSAPSAYGIDHRPTHHGAVHGSPTSGGFTVAVTDHFSTHAQGGNEIAGEARRPEGPNAISSSATQTVDIGTRLFNSFCSGTNWISACDASADTASIPATEPAPVLPAAPLVGSSLVLTALRRLDLSPSKLQIQPPNGRTLVNFDTNFYTKQPSFDRTVTLLGRRVDLRIWPSQFRWVFGDGSAVPSASPGAPYPDLLITHKYLHRGGVNPRVDTTYSARFRVDGGAWRDVAGTVTIPGEPVALRVITATPVLVGSD